MSWKESKALLALLKQVNEAYPNRDKSWDGTIGDTAHSERKSDHNPNSSGVVCALDITHDPANGFDSYKFADLLRQKKDKRIQYVISNRRIANADVSPWQWRKYTGSNPHDHHVHISVRQSLKYWDDASPWDIGEPMAPVGDKQVVKHPILRKDSTGEDVKRVQYLLGLPTSGKFDATTKAFVRAFQHDKGLVEDGTVGQYTWREFDSMSSPWKEIA